MNSAAEVREAPEQRRGPHAVDGPDEPGSAPERTEVASTLEVHRNGALAGMVGVLASAVAILWLGRATAGNAVLDWALVAVMALVAVGYLRAALDARTPLLVADAHGVRVRLGRGWRGLPWDAVDEVEHRPRRGLRDGRLAIAPRDPERFLVDLDRSGRRQARLAERLYGAPLGVPLGASTRLVGVDDDLVAQLEALADSSVRIVDRPLGAVDAEPAEESLDEPPEAPLGDLDAFPDEPAEAEVVSEDWSAGAWFADDRFADDLPADDRFADDLPAEDWPGDDEIDPDGEDERSPRVRDPRPWLARLLGGRRGDRVDAEVEPEGVRLVGEPLDDVVPVGLDPVAPVVAHPAEPQPADDEPAAGPAAADDGSDRVRPIARPGQPVAALVVDDFQVEPAEDPVIGPDITAARTRLVLTVDQLAERTRIRPHVIESIEVDDFAPCGGDFYARGHLRTLARVLGIDVTPLLARYDARYAHAPVDARRVFEAELASAGARVRSARSRGGPNWSVLVAAIMAVVLCWSVAQLVLDAPPDVRPPTPTLRNGSAGVGNGAVTDAEPVPVLVGAVQGGATIEVRDGAGETVFAGDVAFGESRALDVVPPVRVTSDDGGAVEVTVAGEWRGRMGRLGEAATETYAVTR